MGKQKDINETPASETPASEAPTSEAPASEAPASEAPASEAPASEAPISEVPISEVPIEPVPKNTEPVVEKREKPQKKEKEKDKEKDSPPIIKKIKKHGHGHHGGAWKIAYADFVTAMMAFFLLMWLLASLNKAQKEGISEYFKQPIKAALTGGTSMGDRALNVKGGGPSITSTDGQVAATKDIVIKKDVKIPKEVSDSSSEEVKKLEQLKSEINLSMDKDSALAGLKKNLIMDITREGLQIQLVDNDKKPMFDVGSDKLNPAVQPILDNIAKLINTSPNKIIIQGHTDANEYHNPQELDYTNWELSSQRANAARRALIKAGMKEDKVVQVAGFSSTVLMDKANPLNPENRRISIIVMKKSEEDKIKALN